MRQETTLVDSELPPIGSKLFPLREAAIKYFMPELFPLEVYPFPLNNYMLFAKLKQKQEILQCLR